MNDNKQYRRVADVGAGKQRGSAMGRVFASLIGWGLLFGLLGAVAVGGAYLAITSPGPLQETKIFEVPQGLGRADIAAALQDQGIVSDARLFSLAAIANQLRGRSLKSGEYDFPANASIRDVVSLLASGRVVTYKVTVPEGWTSEMAVARLKDNQVLTGDVTQVPPEGAIMADTFVFRRGMTRDKILADMQAAQTRLVDDLWAKRPPDTILKSKEDLVTLASIVEKETGEAEERPQVAAVFVNRLKKKHAAAI